MTKVDCPVCGKTDLADHLAQCPQCNADLECFRLLEALYEEQSTPGVEAEVVRSLSRRVEDIGLLLQRLQDSLHQVQQAAKRRTACSPGLRSGLGYRAEPAARRAFAVLVERPT